ncbi:hypothetical protein Scep_029971 [Stephania cephalantha]|uniref:RNA helicase n=1 Tax=Stephania cephalantha TaxID=152367 RepID=A0AAP0DYN9_9MAGN
MPFSESARSNRKNVENGSRFVVKEVSHFTLLIFSVEKRLVEEVRKHETLIIVGETGSGKTTQLPQFLFNAGFCCNVEVIGITQPRRVAVVSVAKRMAEECSVEVGQKVGYSIRFDDMTSSSTRIKYMTDGLLLREALLDPYLSRYSVIIIDEAHERTLHTDVLLGLLKNVQLARSHTSGQLCNYGNMKANSGIICMNENNAQRSNLQKRCQNTKYPPLKLIIMSASLDAKGFSEYFGGARAVHVQGRQYPIEILYTHHPEFDYIDAVLITIFQIVARSYWQRILLETSVTIPGIKYVIDPGLVKVCSYNPCTGIESLVIVPISKAQALQRSGRAGREGPGKCYRLYPEIEFGKLLNSTVPEIKRCNLSNIILQLKALGIDDIIGFDFMEKPSSTTGKIDTVKQASIVKSLEELFLLGALTDDYKLSDPVGKQMTGLPLDPIYSKALILASDFNCMEEMLITVAMLSVESIFYAPQEKLEEARGARIKSSSIEGDHQTLLNVYRGASEFLEKIKTTGSKDKIAGKSLFKWCRDNFINSRSLQQARDIHSFLAREMLGRPAGNTHAGHPHKKLCFMGVSPTPKYVSRCSAEVFPAGHPSIFLLLNNGNLVYQIRGQIENMSLRVASCGDDMVQFQRCLAASFFLNAALKQPNGSYRLWRKVQWLMTKIESNTQIVSDIDMERGMANRGNSRRGNAEGGHRTPVGSKGDLYYPLLVNARAPIVLPWKLLVKEINSVAACL